MQYLTVLMGDTHMLTWLSGIELSNYFCLCSRVKQTIISNNTASNPNSWTSQLRVLGGVDVMCCALPPGYPGHGSWLRGSAVV